MDIPDGSSFFLAFVELGIDGAAVDVRAHAGEFRLVFITEVVGVDRDDFTRLLGERCRDAGLGDFHRVRLGHDVAAADRQFHLLEGLLVKVLHHLRELRTGGALRRGRAQLAEEDVARLLELVQNDRLRRRVGVRSVAARAERERRNHVRRPPSLHHLVDRVSHALHPVAHVSRTGHEARVDEALILREPVLQFHQRHVQVFHPVVAALVVSGRDRGIVHAHLVHQRHVEPTLRGLHKVLDAVQRPVREHPRVSRREDGNRGRHSLEAGREHARGL
mmetsp:Transcript_18381/g.45906  ORF Transcript_18381/g.45906 Transcript_18381/m.45906 type:complete len:276 (-) Transcript_18381:971-1798(-)